MRKTAQRILTAACLALWSASIFGQGIFGVAQTSEGRVSVLYNENDTPGPLPGSRQSTVWGGVVLIGGPAGGVVRLQWKEGEPDYVRLKEKERYSIPMPKVPHLARKSEGEFREMMRMGSLGLTKSGAGTLHAPPTGATILLDGPIKLRWKPTQSGKTVRVEVRPPDHPPIWTEAFPGTSGAAQSSTLADRLLKSSQSGNSRFFFALRVEGEKESEEENECVVLSPAERAELDRNLAVCDQSATGPARHLLRASAYYNLKALEKALEELDAVLADPEFGRQEPFLRLALNLSSEAGEHDLERDFAARLEGLPKE